MAQQSYRQQAPPGGGPQGPQATHIPPMQGELPSSSVHLVSPSRPQHLIKAPLSHQASAQALSSVAPSYQHQMVRFPPNLQPVAPPHLQPQQLAYQQAPSQPPHQAQPGPMAMNTSFQSQQSQHGDPQLLLRQLQGHSSNQNGVQPPIAMPSQQYGAGPQAPVQATPYDQSSYQHNYQRSKPPPGHGSQSTGAKPSQIAQRRPAVAQQKPQGPSLHKVMSKHEINFHEENNDRGASLEATEIVPHFKKTGDFGSSSQQKLQRGSPHQGRPTGGQNHHYDTSPNRPPTFSNNLEESQKTDLDGTASYQTNSGAHHAAAAAVSQSSLAEKSRRKLAQSTAAKPASLAQPRPQQQITSQSVATHQANQTGLIKVNLSHEAAGQEVSPLPSLQFQMPIASVASLFSVLDKLQKVPRQQVTVGMLEHTKDALWLLNKILASKDYSLQQVLAHSEDAQTCQQSLLSNLNQTLETFYASQSELVLACLRVLVTYLQKLDTEGHILPIEQVKTSNLLANGLRKCLLLDPIGAATSIHLTLKTLTQVSFTCPQEIGKDLVTKVLEFCGSQDDSVAQENSIKLICNLLTNEQSCQVVLSIAHDVVNGIYQCLQSLSKSAVKFSLGALLNLTLLSDDLRLQSCETILHTGGLSHLVCAVQKTYNTNDFESMHFGMKALSNLVGHHPPVVKILTLELGYLDILFQLCRQMYQTVVKTTAQETGRNAKAHQTRKRNDLLRMSIAVTLQVIDSVAVAHGPSSNKERLLTEAGFLPFVNRMVLLSVDKPAELYQATMQGILAQLATLCRSAWKFSKKIAEWEQEEFSGNLLSLLESTDSDMVLAQGLQVFVDMQESGLLLTEETQTRLKELNHQQSSSQVTLTQETKEALKRLIYLIHNTPFEKKALTPSQLSVEEAYSLDEYKRAQQEASAGGIAQGLGASPLKRRLGQQQSESQPAVYSQANQAIPTKTPVQRQGSRQRVASRGSRAPAPGSQTSQKLSKNALSQLEAQSMQHQQRNRGVGGLVAESAKYGTSEVDESHTTSHLLENTSNGDLQSNATHQQMLNRLETISLQESSRKGQSRALSLIAGSNSKGKSRGASSVAAIGGPLPPKIPPPTGHPVSGVGNFIAGKGSGSVSHRKQSQLLRDPLNNSLLIRDDRQASGEDSLTYQVAQSRSKSLIRGAGSQTQRPSGIGTGTSRLTLNQTQLGNGRQRKFEEYVERFNQLDPLVKGQTIDYTDKQSSSLETSHLQRGAMQTASTIQHQTSKHLGHHQPQQVPPQSSSVAHSAINAVEDTKVQLGLKKATTGKPYVDTQAFINQNIHEISSMRSGAGGPVAGGGGVESIAGDQEDQVPWHQLNYARAESRGSEVAVHKQSFGLKNSVTAGQQSASEVRSYTSGPAMVPQEADSEAPPEIQEEYMQPTYQGYYAEQLQKVTHQHDFEPVNPFPSLEVTSPPQIQSVASKHQPTLASVSEEQEEAYHYQKTQQPPSVQLQPKQNQRRVVGGEPLAQPAQPPRTMEEMVRQNQQIIAQKSQRGQQQAQQPSRNGVETQSMVSDAKSVNPAEFAGQEKELVERYADVNLMDKDSFESRQARFQMGIGMPEARALLKRSYGGSFRQQVEWFAQTVAQSGQTTAYNEVKKAVCSNQNTAKLVGLYVLAAHQMGFPMADF